MSGRHAHAEVDLEAPARAFVRYVVVPLSVLPAWLSAGWRVRYRTPTGACLFGAGVAEPPGAPGEW